MKKKYHTKIQGGHHNVFDSLIGKLGTKVVPDALKNIAFFDSFDGANYLE